MFEKFTKKFITNATQTVKEEINVSIGKQIPVLLGAIVVCVTVIALMDTKKSEIIEGGTTIVTNNYYFG